MVEITRPKWWEDLEDLLQCPICLERPKDRIHQCVAGHPICYKCKQKIAACPLCKGQWSGSRNRLAESLCRKLDVIKASLINSEGELHKLLVQNGISFSVTGEIDVAGRRQDFPQGRFPCCIGICCTILHFGPMLKHIPTSHPTEFIELRLVDYSVEHTWEFEYTEEYSMDCAFRVAEMGNFFLNVFSDVFRNLAALVLMVDDATVSNQFTYQVEIGCCDEHKLKTYTSDVCSCRTPQTEFAEQSLMIAAKADIDRMILHRRQWKCTLRIRKKPQDGEAGPTN